jgi:CRISPR-associated endoribonuclease Cas6
LHERKGYKFFCFSNIFPFGDFKVNEERKLLISSPNENIMNAIVRSLKNKARSDEELKVGEMAFQIVRFEGPFRLRLYKPKARVRTETPIIIRIPSYKLVNIHSIGKNISKYRYVYWRETISPAYFLTQLYDNMEKKIKEYNIRSETDNFIPYSARNGGAPRPSLSRFIRTVSKRITVRGIEHVVIGSLWEFEFLFDSNIDMQMLEFILDCGLGERNSLGFGFCNLAS